jgi:hypothetical protein
MPPELPRMALAAVVMVVLTAVFWRWLKIATFDEGFAEALGIPAAAVGFGLVIAAALAAVAAFEAVGSIIVIAMFICPPATARLMTSNLGQQVLLSVGLRRRFGDPGLRACGVRTLVAGRGGFGQRRGDDRDGFGRASGSGLPGRTAPPPGRSRRSGLRRLIRGDAGRLLRPQWFTAKVPQSVNSVRTSFGLCLIAA